MSVGGVTNMGANVSSGKLGGLDGTPLSGSILVAPIRKANFDGVMTYNDSSEECYSVQTGGIDVSVYATGFRNRYVREIHPAYRPGLERRDWGALPQMELSTSWQFLCLGKCG